MFMIAREKLTGGTENILIMPGISFELGHFYGARDAALFTALVTGSHLHVRALWPRDLAAPPADAETGELAQVEFNAADWGKDSNKRYCRNMV
jgi:hypothetical protein